VSSDTISFYFINLFIFFYLFKNTTATPKAATLAPLIRKASELQDWLAQLNLQQYRGIFMHHELYLDVLPDIDENTLKSIGISNNEHRIKILKGTKLIVRDDTMPTKDSGMHSLSSLDEPQGPTLRF